MSTEEARVFETPDLEVIFGNFLPAAHASVGEMEEANRVARYSLQRGSLYPYWTVLFQLTSADPRKLPVFEEYEAEVQRLREMY